MRELRIAKLNFFHCCNNPKYMVVLLYLFLYSYNRIHELTRCAQDLGTLINPWIFPFLPGLGAGFLPLMLGFVMLISDAPFRTRQQGLVMQRTGKRAWLAGQLLYLFAVSLGFTVLMWVLSWIWLLPELNWSKNWGPMLTTLAINGGVPPGYEVWLDFPYDVVKNTDPLTVTLWCSTAMIAVCFLLGVIMTACNLWMKKGWGAVIIAALTAISLIPDTKSFNPGPIRYILWISPLNWMDYSLMGHPEQYLPSRAFAIWGPTLLGVGLSTILLLTIGKCSVDTDKE